MTDSRINMGEGRVFTVLLRLGAPAMVSMFFTTLYALVDTIFVAKLGTIPLAAILKHSGYFLGGILPRWFDTDGLLMQKIKGKPNWEEMQIHYDDDRKIVDLIRADWQLS